MRHRSFATVVLVALASATSGEAARKVPAKTEELLERGKATYDIYCVACHGEAGAGDGSAAARLDPRPRDFRTGKFKRGSRVDQIFDTLGKGLPGSAMVKFTNLTEADRWALAFYVLDLKAKKPPR
jgi:mono/diheme cytochrome c family protein